MAYRVTQIHTVIADDSNLNGVEWDHDASFYQTLDQQVFSTKKRVQPGDPEVQIVLGPITSGCFIEIRTDYPVMVRLNGAGATQFTMKSNNTPPTNVGAQPPDQCIFAADIVVTSLYLAPIAGAQQTANVKIAVTGDPTNPYT
ncbi:MAG TPA: hypothetical protein VJ891_16920 [Casimicrobiaceae bacterium]|nr:hypothetical protein [Casimicrobiaceae bacterium]